MSNEIWKKIIVDNKETIYSVSNLGNVRNDVTNRLLKLYYDKGYVFVGLSINKKGRRFRVHRLVAEMFIENPENKPYVNHIDGNGTNNNSSNLEWVTPSENTRHAIDTGLMNNASKKEVSQYDLDGNYIATFDSITEAGEKTNSNPEKIVECCRLRRITSNKFQWRYGNSKENIGHVDISTYSKKVAQIDFKGNIVAIHDSIRDAARAVNGSSSAISRILIGINKTHKGYYWKLADDIVQ